ncbi:MAG: hypothetical protein GY742_16060 [Hyphomicrobiales bacterium]|nr:hypothetical protein [Hyphomicrobiales bacterium]
MTSNPSGFAGAWLGGNYTQWLRGPEAGSSLVYTNWNTAEPNSNGLMYMSVGLTTPNSGAAGLGKWLDDSGVQGVPSSADPVVGYFIEYEGVSAVPLPAALPCSHRPCHPGLRRLAQEASGSSSSVNNNSVKIKKG